MRHFVALATYSLALLSSSALADPPPGGTPPPAICGNRQALTTGALDDGHYVGLEPIDLSRGADSLEKGSKWFHEVVITLQGGKASSTESPVVYRHGKRYQSASDGGFYHFEGCLDADGDHYRSDMRLVSCEYCGESKIALTKTLSIKPLGLDITVGGKRYRRTATQR